MGKRKNKNSFIKQNKYLLLAVVILLVLVVGITIFQKSYAFNGADGTSGDCNWNINASGKLTIEPSSGSSCTLGTSTSGQMPWYNYRNNITSVVVNSGVKANANSFGLFRDLPNATSINLSNLDTSSVTNMQAMFQDCASLTSLDLSNFNTNNVIQMDFMFYNCNSLASINFGSNFNTSSVTNMKAMFAFCESLANLNLSTFSTSNVTDMSFMFQNCTSFTGINFGSNFNTNNVINMHGMFAGCVGLTNLNLSNFNTSSVTNMASMFEGCNSLTSLDLSNFNTNNVTNMEAMFAFCESLANLNLSSFTTSNVTNINSMFYELGFNKNEGTKITLNKTFNKTYSVDSSYCFPYSYYAKEVNGELSNELYTLSAMQTETTGSNTPTTWVPAYSVSYDKGSGDSVSGTPNPKIYRIGSKVDTRGYNATKTHYILSNWNTSLDGTGTSFSKNALSDKSYGNKYNSEGLTNGGLTLYAQWNQIPLADDVVFIKEDKDTGNPVEGVEFRLSGESDAGEEVNETRTSDRNGKVLFEDIPKGEYELKEISVPDGYKLNQEIFKVYVAR